MTSERDRGAILLFALIPLIAVIGFVWVQEGALVSPAQLWAVHLATAFPSNAADVFFLPGASPLGAVAYAPFAAYGSNVFFNAHTLFALVALPAVYVHARKKGVRWPVLAVLFIATSPSMLAAGPAGMPGSDGLVLVAFALYAADVRRAPLLAGVLLGLASLVQLEVTVIAAGVALIHRDRKILGAAVGIPLVYLACGTVLGGVTWLGAALGTPSLAGPAAAVGATGMAIACVIAVLSACPAVGLLVLQRADELGREERGYLRLAGAFTALIAISGALDFGAVGLNPTRLLPALPLVAPALARGAVALSEGRHPGRANVALLVLLVVAAGVSLGAADRFPMLLAAACALVVVAARIKKVVFAPVILAVTLVGGVGMVRSSGLGTADQNPGFATLTAFFEADSSVIVNRPVITNVPIVAPLFRNGAAEVRFSFEGRAGAPLLRSGDVQGRAAMLAGHPFGEPIDGVPDVASLPPTTVLIVEGEELRARLGDDPSLRALADADIAIFESADAANATQIPMSTEGP